MTSVALRTSVATPDAPHICARLDRAAVGDHARSSDALHHVSLVKVEYLPIVSIGQIVQHVEFRIGALKMD